MKQLSTDGVTGNGRFNQQEAKFLDYPWKKGKNVLEMHIIWNLPGFGPVTKNPLRIKFGEYEPEGTTINSTESQWKNTNGELVKVEQPPYAVYDTRALTTDVEVWSTQILPYVDQWILDRTRHDEVAFLTYREALRLRNKPGPGIELLKVALQIQYLSIISQGYGSVWSTNVPGIKGYDYRVLGHSVYEPYDRNSIDRPLPIAISHSMDVAIVNYLGRFEEQCLKLLSKEVLTKHWYEVFLTLFVLYWNMEYIHSVAEAYIRSKTGTVSR
jgi:hypothetical protein